MQYSFTCTILSSIQLDKMLMSWHLIMPNFHHADISTSGIGIKGTRWNRRMIVTNLANDALMQLLLYGDQVLFYDLNKNILELTLCFVHETGRFD